MRLELRYRLSIISNAVLALTVILLGGLSRPDEETGPRARVVRVVDQNGRNNHAREISEESTSGDAGARESELFSEVSRLRAAGIADHTIAQVIEAENSLKWERRIKECQENVARGQAEVTALGLLEVECEKERDANLREALGDEGFKRWDRRSLLRYTGMDRARLSEQETDAVYHFQKELQVRRRELQEEELKGKIDMSDFSAALDKATEECGRKTKALLGDERYSQATKVDDAANELVRQLGSINATEAQIKALVEAQDKCSKERAELDSRIRQEPALEATYAEQVAAIERARDQTYEQALGGAGFALLRKQEDVRYGMMKRYASAWGLDAQSIEHVYNMVRTFESSNKAARDRAQALEAQGQRVDWDAVNRATEDAAEQARLSLKNFLGQDRYNKLKRGNIIPAGE